MSSLNPLKFVHQPEARCIGADPVRRRFVYETKTGKWDVKVDVGSPSRLSIQRESKDIGTIIQSTYFSGSIWISADEHLGRLENECIGEYSFNEGRYSITPYESCSKCPDKGEEIHPLDYLIRVIEQSS